MTSGFQELAAGLRQELENIPPALRQEEVTRQALIVALCAALRQMGLIPVPAWKPPRSTRERLDLVGVEPGADPPVVKVAFAVDPLVELPKLKGLEWVDCPEKVVVTFSDRADKVSQSTFFLAPGMTHLNLYD